MRREGEWVPAGMRPMLQRERRRLARLQGRVIDSVYLNGGMNTLEIVCTDGTALRIQTSSMNHVARMSVLPIRRR